MKIIKMAGRSYLGYRLKAASILIFASIAFTLILGGTNLLYNSFSIWFDRSCDFCLPRFFVSAKPGFDFDSDFGIRDMAIRETERQAVKKALARDFEATDIAFMFAQLSDKEDQQNATYALVFGIDFSRIEKAFPWFSGRLGAERAALYGQSPLVLLNRRALDNIKVAEGSELVLASSDYHRDFNAMKLTVGDIVPDAMMDGDFLNMPTAFVDISQLSRLFGMPEGYGPGIILRPKRPTPIFSLGNAALTAKIETAIRPYGLGLKDASTISPDMQSTFSVYRNVINAFIAVLSVVLCLSVSSNLFISFQGRRADFGLYKAFGCGNGRIFLLVLAENAFGVALPLAIAFLANVLIGVFLKPFPIMGGWFTLTPGFTDLGVVTVLAVAAAICIISVIQSYRYLARLEPVSIMREE